MLWLTRALAHPYAREVVVRVSNLPTGLRELIPAELAPTGADFVVLDRTALDKAKSADEASGLAARLVGAYSRLMGAETILVVLADVPDDLKNAAKALSGSDAGITGQQLMTALETPSAVDPKLLAALPALAELVHEQLGREEMLKGTLAQGVPAKRMSQAEVARWFAAAVADIRGEGGSEPIDEVGATQLIKLTKKLMLNFGGGLITRSFFDDAVKDLHGAPGLSDDAIGLLAKFRTLIQPGRTSHTRSDQGALVAIDMAARRAAERTFLNETQAAAVDGVEARNKDRIAAARTNVIAAIAPWGFGEVDLDKTLAYLKRYAPVTIQFHPDKQVPGGGAVIDKMLEAPAYKNQFETKISGGSLGPTAGSSRDGWEKTIFDGKYHTHPLIPEERPKYGGLSALNSPKGNGGDWYGSCFFELRQDVKFRTTFTPKNSSGAKTLDVTAIDSLEILLDQVRERDPKYLKSMFEVARGDRASITQAYGGNYIEAQIHGTLDLTRDVEFIVVDAKYLTTPYGAKLEALAEKIGATIKFTDKTKFYVAD